MKDKKPEGLDKSTKYVISLKTESDDKLIKFISEKKLKFDIEEVCKEGNCSHCATGYEIEKKLKEKWGLQ